MRLPAILALLVATGCTPQNGAENASINLASTQDNAVAAMAKPVITAEAREAKAVVEHYYALIKQEKFAEARLLWDDDGAASGGDAKAFAATITPYSEYVPTIGDPTEVKTTAGKQYVGVAAKLHVKRRSNKAVADRDGAVLLRRAAVATPGAARPEWRIWSIDIRAHH